jgi:imidazolonepropionase-like amidohydrolase
MGRNIGRATLMACAAFAALSVSGSVDAQGQQALVIRGGTLIDGNGGAPVANSVIVIQGNRIAAVGRAGQVQVPAGAQIIEAQGKWITPGIIDAKSNWNWPYGEAYLRWGVTSAMVTGTRNDTGMADRDAVDHGVYAAPRLYQGFLNLRGPGKDGKKPDTYKPGDGNRLVRNVENARAQVRYNIESGADFIGTNDGDGDPAIFAAIADEAHKAGKAVVMRCVGPQTRGKECVLAGADVMVHTGEIGNQIAKDEAKWADYIALPPDPYCDMDEAKEKEMIRFLMQHPETALEPDMMATDRGFHSNWKRVQQEDEEFFKDPGLRAYYPLFQMQHTLDNVRDPSTYLTPQQVELRACGYKNKVKFLHDYTQAGGHLVAASDIYQSPPGLGVHQEMTAYQEELGMSPMKALQSGTKWVADHFRMSKDLGTVEKGKLADLVIVTANPVQDIKNLRQIDTVIKDGKVVDRSYHADYKGWLFADDPKNSEFDTVVGGGSWTGALKQATFRPGGGGNQNITGAAAPMRPVPDPWASPTPGIETMMPHTLIQGTPTQTLDITGFNFVKRSVVYVDDKPVPTQVVSPTQIKATVDTAILANPGKKLVVVKNPLPLDAPEWGEKSNEARLLVPFAFTTKWSQNKDAVKY